VPYKNVDDLASVWCEFCEMEIRHEYYDRALQVIQKATAMPSRKAAYHDDVLAILLEVYINDSFNFIE
jgi:pre-mRNA-splicing factor SYF1